MVPANSYPLVLVVIDKLREGHSLSRACRDSNVSISIVKTACRADPDLATLYDEALQEGDDAIADALLNPFNDEVYGETDEKKAAIWSANAKWLLSRRRPEKFGDKVTVTTTSADTAIISALNEAIKRIPVPKNHEEATYIDVTPGLIEEDVDPASLF